MPGAAFPKGAILLPRISSCPSPPQPIFPHLGASAGGNSHLDSAGWAAHPGHSPGTVGRGSWVRGRAPPISLCQGRSVGVWPDPSSTESTLQTLAEPLSCMGHCRVGAGSREEVGREQGTAPAWLHALPCASMAGGRMYSQLSALVDTLGCATIKVSLPSISHVPSTDLGT